MFINFTINYRLSSNTTLTPLQKTDCLRFILPGFILAKQILDLYSNINEFKPNLKDYVRIQRKNLKN